MRRSSTSAGATSSASPTRSSSSRRRGDADARTSGDAPIGGATASRPAADSRRRPAAGSHHLAAGSHRPAAGSHHLAAGSHRPAADSRRRRAPPPFFEHRLRLLVRGRRGHHQHAEVRDDAEQHVRQSQGSREMPVLMWTSTPSTNSTTCSGEPQDQHRGDQRRERIDRLQRRRQLLRRHDEQRCRRRRASSTTKPSRLWMISSDRHAAEPERHVEHVECTPGPACRHRPR